MAKIEIGTMAPDFSLNDKDGTRHTLSKIKSDFKVVFFYPKDDTPGCTIEAKEISDALAAFQKEGVALFGISGGDAKSKAKFCTKHNLAVTLLSDTDLAVAQAYESYGEKSFMGRKFKGIFRPTFVIDKRGKIVKIFDGVKPAGHAAELLAALKEMKGGSVGKAVSSPKAAAQPRSKKAKAPPAVKSGKKVSAKKVGARKASKKVSVKKVALKAKPSAKKKATAVKKRR